MSKDRPFCGCRRCADGVYDVTSGQQKPHCMNTTAIEGTPCWLCSEDTHSPRSKAEAAANLREHKRRVEGEEARYNVDRARGSADKGVATPSDGSTDREHELACRAVVAALTELGIEVEYEPVVRTRGKVKHDMLVADRPTTVRWADHHEKNLINFPNKDETLDSVLFFLVTGRGPDKWVRGFATREEAFAKTRDFGYGNEPFFVARKDLHPLSDLIS